MPVIPELTLPDPSDGYRTLTEVFGFLPDSGLLRLGDQRLAIASGPPLGHGAIDHLALAFPDVDAAARKSIARGAVPDPEVTPDGPLEIPEFGEGGVRYLFLQGPGGARIELISDLASPAGPGHGHIGLPCSDIAATTTFLTGLGAEVRSAVTLERPDGTTLVRFLALQESLLELYQTPKALPWKGPGLWKRLRISGAADATGPDGLMICPA